MELTWDQLVDVGLADDGMYQIGTSATNEDGYSAQAFTTLSISNAPPVVTVAADESVPVGVPVEVSFAAADPGADRVLQWWIDWDDDSLPEIFGSSAYVGDTRFRQPRILHDSGGRPG